MDTFEVYCTLREEVRDFLETGIDPQQLPDSDFNAGSSAEFSASLGARGWIGMTWPLLEPGLKKLTVAGC